MAKLELEPGDPPVFLMVIPPFGPNWVERMESMGAVEATNALKERLSAATGDERRDIAWESARGVAEAAAAHGGAGAILMGLRFDTVVDEAALEWRTMPMSQRDTRWGDARDRSHQPHGLPHPDTWS